MSFKPIPNLSGTQADFTGDITAGAISLDAENGGGIYNSTYSDVNILPKSNAFEFNVRTSSNVGKLRVSTDGSLYLASNANAINLGRLYNNIYPKRQLQLSFSGSGYTAFFDRDGVNELMRVDGATGNVGIGTTSPEDKLDIVGRLRISDNKTANTNKTNRIRGEHYNIAEEPHTFMFMNSFSTSSHLYIGGGSSIENAATSLKFFTAANNTTVAGTERMCIDSSGNVGIGTTSPVEKLHVDEGYILADGASTGHGFELRRDSFDTFQIRHLGGNFTINNLTYNRKDLSIDGSGNVGIGTDNPISSLDVNGTISLNGETENKLYKSSTSPANGVATNTTVLQGRQIDLYALDDIVLRTGTSQHDDIIFFAGNSEKAIIKGDGNVGIGTTSPSSLLHLASTGPAVLTIEADTDNVTETDNARIVLKQDGGAVVGRVGYENNTNALEIINEFNDSLSLGTNNSKRLLINGSGNVGINTSSPEQELHVYQGTAKFESTNGSDVSLQLGRSDVSNLWNFNHAGADLRIYNSGGSGYDVLFGVNSGGTSQSNKVGIGTATPSTALHVNGTITHKVYTVSALPSASPAGQRSFVSDASSVLDVNLGATVSAGGSNLVPVFSDGSNWIVG